MAVPPVVDVAWVSKRLGDLTICDVRWYLDGRSGEAGYRSGHLPGAVFVDLDTVLAAPPGPDVGRHPLPSPDDFAAALGSLGIGDDHTVVAYDDAGGMVAGRLVWMLRILGQDAALLDGGLAAWSGELSTDIPGTTPVPRHPRDWPSEAVVDAAGLVAALRAGEAVIDSRSPERYRGEHEPVDPRPGHVPGAANLPFTGNLGADGRFLDPTALRTRFEEAGVDGDSVVYCGSGVSACVNLLAAEAAGVGRPRLFVGSWSGWSSDPERPAACGADREEPPMYRLFGDHARSQGDKVAVTLGNATLTYAELDRRSTDLAAHLVGMGVGPERFVTIAEPNSFEFFVACAACWKLGAIPQPVSSRLPPIELGAIVELADSAAVIGMEHDTRPSLPPGFRAEPVPTTLPEPPIASAWKAPTSGGSTGRPKLIVSGDPAVFSSNLQGFARILGAQAHDTMVVPGPMYHNGPLIWAWLTLFSGGHLVLHRRFDAEATLASIQGHRATSLYAVPTMLQRIWRLPDDTKFSYDLSSLRILYHLAEPCPRWLKEAWIDWLGPDVIWELYGGTEGMCFTVLDGNEWLEHPGSVGRPINGELKIMDEDGNDLPPGEHGEVWMRAVGRDTPTYRYIGDEPHPRDGWECLGDMGWLDEDGYLYLTDRRTDMILVGGANVFPAEVEAAIGAHPGVRSSAVIGLPDEVKGHRVHAIVDASGVTEDELLRFLAERLVSYKLPESVEFVSEPLRDDAGKVRRAALRAERLAR